MKLSTVLTGAILLPTVFSLPLMPLENSNTTKDAAYSSNDEFKGYNTTYNRTSEAADALEEEFRTLGKTPETISLRLPWPGDRTDMTGSQLRNPTMKSRSGIELLYGARSRYSVSNFQYSDIFFGGIYRIYGLDETITDGQANRTKALELCGKTWQEVLDDRDFNSQGKRHKYPSEIRRHSILTPLPIGEIAIENLLRKDAVRWAREKKIGLLRNKNLQMTSDPPNMTPLFGPNVQGWTTPLYVTENITEDTLPATRGDRRLSRNVASSLQGIPVSPLTNKLSRRKVDAAPTGIADALHLWKEYRMLARKAVDPIVRKMVEGQDSVWYYEVALAVWQITRPSTMMNGPFYYDMTGFDKQMDIDINLDKIPEDAQRGLFALDAALLHLFHSNWAKAQKALDNIGIENNWSVLDMWLAPKDDDTVIEDLKSLGTIDKTQQFLLDGLKNATFMEDTERHTVSTESTNTPRPLEQPVPQHIVPFSDGQCEHEIKNWSFINTMHDRVHKDYFAIDMQSNDRAFSGNTARRVYGEVTMDIDVDDKNGEASGYSVWWQIKSVPQGCRYIIMKPYADRSYGYVGMAPGNIILNAGGPGCFYSHFRVQQELSMTYCCGMQDCDMYNAGYDSMYTIGVQKRDFVSTS